MTAKPGSPCSRTYPRLEEASARTLFCLGTARGALPRQPANLLAVGSALYLIDAGDGATRRIGQAGYDFRQIGKIFLTHLHGDHTAGRAPLLF